MQRRRTQVRLAQQTYTHRKEAFITSLKTENKDLRDRLANMQLCFDQLLENTLKVTTGLPPKDQEGIHSSCKWFKNCTMPTAAANDENGNGPPTGEGKLTNTFDPESVSHIVERKSCSTVQSFMTESKPTKPTLIAAPSDAQRSFRRTYINEAGYQPSTHIICRMHSRSSVVWITQFELAT